MGNTKIERVVPDQFRLYLSQSLTGGIHVLQFTDHHLGKQGFWREDLLSFRRMRDLVDQYEPHLIAVTGDLLTGEKPCGDLLCAFATQFFDDLKVPWLYVFGNHDPEGGMSRDAIAEVFQASDWCILGHHAGPDSSGKRYDYQIQILADGESQPAWEIYAFDSGTGKGTMRIQEDQLDWYQQRSLESLHLHARQIPAISVFHIPLRQYQQLWDDISLKKHGESKEPVCYEDDDGSVYETFLEVGNVRATFCGHDHYNNYWGTYPGGITLAYGHISGEATNWAWPTGGKLITLGLDGYALDIRNVMPDESAEVRRG